MFAEQRVVWFNEGLENLYDIFQGLRAADVAGKLRLLASARNGQPWCASLADHVFHEPGRSGNAAYIEWALEKCQEYAVDMFVPMRSRHQVAAAESRFAAIGVQLLIAADGRTMRHMSSKSRVYDDLAALQVGIPAWYRASNLTDFDEAYDRLREAGHVVCVKPAQGVYGRGFHVIGEPDNRRFSGASESTRLGRPLQKMREVLEKRGTFDMVVMQYLEGPERSVDCVARAGRLVAAVSRVKRSGYQEIESPEAPSMEFARIIAKRFVMDGIFNVQTRDHAGKSWLLEVNTRPSGGIGQAMASGVNLPWWAIAPRLGLAHESEVPAPQVGLRVTVIPHAVVVGHASIPSAPAFTHAGPVGAVRQRGSE